MTRRQSRRRFLKAAAATSVVAGLNAAVLARGQETDEQTILLGGRTSGWLGYRVPGGEPDADSNPTLNLQPGTTYTLLWKNVDAQPHNFAIQDSNGNNLQVLRPISVSADQFESMNQSAGNQTAGNDSGMMGNDSGMMGDNGTTTAGGELLAQTEIISEQGAVQGVQFTATEEMATYICLVHPNTMVGEVSLSGGDGGAGNNSSA
ncbi:twin-arginine translocation signal domain-containing protein [Halorussus halophilus]|uniref:twin-arginine translocation signal domain-containing protein n=1 Tax=Halorussus halophilus TaxID=2650975 RepID=UPI001787913D|nr:twin-arginine translocation signal domain-containing protein [Halorussus halophilus]